MSKITYTDYYTPDNQIQIDDFLSQVNNKDIPQGFGNKDEYKEFIVSVLTLSSIREEKKLSPDEMICGLIDKALDKKAFKPEEIDLIIVAQDVNNYHTKNIGHYIQNKYHMKKAHPVHISGNQCINIEMALNYSKFIQKSANNNHTILIISASKKESATSRIFNSYAICGDGAGIILLKNNSNTGIEIIDSEISCNGALAKSNFEGNSIAHCTYTIKSLQQLIERNELAQNTDKIIIQNANPLLASQCLQSQGYEDEMIFYENLGKYGHLDQLDFLVNLHDCIKNKNVKNILSFGFGSAGSYLSMLLSNQTN